MKIYLRGVLKKLTFVWGGLSNLNFWGILKGQACPKFLSTLACFG